MKPKMDFRHNHLNTKYKADAIAAPVNGAITGTHENAQSLFPLFLIGSPAITRAPQPNL
jgi:hypothetical protein